MCVRLMWSVMVVFVFTGPLGAPIPRPPYTIESVCTEPDPTIAAEGTRYFNHLGWGFKLDNITAFPDDVENLVALRDALYNEAKDGALEDASLNGRLTAVKNLLKGIGLDGDADSIYQNILDITIFLDEDAQIDPNINTTAAAQSVSELLMTDEPEEPAARAMASARVRPYGIFQKIVQLKSEMQKETEGADSSDSLERLIQLSQTLVQGEGELGAVPEDSHCKRSVIAQRAVQDDDEGGAVFGDSVCKRTEHVKAVIQSDGEGGAVAEDSIYKRSERVKRKIQADGEGGAVSADSAYVRTDRVAEMVMSDDDDDVLSPTSLYKRTDLVRAFLQKESEGALQKDSAYRRARTVSKMLMSDDDASDAGDSLYLRASVAQERIYQSDLSITDSVCRRANIVKADLIGDVTRLTGEDIAHYTPPPNPVGEDIYGQLAEALRVLSIVLNPNNMDAGNVASPVAYTVLDMKQATLVDVIKSIKPLGSL